MFNLLGYMLGFYLMYILLALCFKHKKGLIISVILGVGVGVTQIVVKQNFFSFCAIAIASLLIFLIPRIQIRNESQNNNQTNDKLKKNDKELSTNENQMDIEINILLERLKNLHDINEQKCLFIKILDLVKEDGGLIEFSIDEIYKFSDIIDLEKANKFLSKDIYEKVLLLHEYLLSEKRMEANYYNYAGYLLRCRDLVLAFVMLTSSSSFVNNTFLENIHKNSTDLEFDYIQGAANLVADNMIGSMEWRMLLRRYKRYIYNIIDDGEEDIDKVEYFDYKEIIGELYFKHQDWFLTVEGSSIVDNLKIESHLKRYNLPTIYNNPNKK